MIKKYLELDKYEEEINWSCSLIEYTEYKNIGHGICVMIWVTDGDQKRTLFGNDLDVVMKRCYEEFLQGIYD